MKKQLYCIKTCLWENDFENNLYEKMDENISYYFTTESGAMDAVNIEMEKAIAMWDLYNDVRGGDSITAYLSKIIYDENGRLGADGDLLYATERRRTEED